MQSVWARQGYAVKVNVERVTVTRAGSGRRVVAGFLAVISISLSSAMIPVFPVVHVGDDNGNGFMTGSDALAAGIEAANRIVDDLIGQGAPDGS